MISQSRRQEIMSHLEQRRSCSIAELAEAFGVSGETIRRDIKAMENDGQVEKLHGGVRIRENPLETSYLRRLKDNQQAKESIGAAAASLVEDGMTVLIDSGTTSYYAAEHLRAANALSVVTNSLLVARQMALIGNNRVFFTGGEINPYYLSAFGNEAISQAVKYAPEIAFFSIGAIDPARGGLDFDMDEAKFKRAMAPMARKVIVLADSSKIGKGGLVHTFHLDQIDTIITDKMPPPEIRSALGAVRILIAE
ncbi:DeoR/GlpR family DNA-binding transcription regulator [Alteraurantiacibacter aquimixticola]|uniref:DeoR/GlpR transcriptional regulator n=1 Tax=Alteraurantiacibacter aquimixticola TaxID=2489173 RepID=A0A4T3F5G1_9SPHN|nr:DeoR/GlpR family DNA-binding transcription regulator [Alteraurantiacibacter aquimixticola]TIX51719.1 DeoR/GlpR transcriptional regulator [Alteraurantiacibacter aquimixticola]